MRPTCVRYEFDVSPQRVWFESDESDVNQIRVHREPDVSPMCVRSESDVSPMRVQCEPDVSPMCVRYESDVSPKQVHYEFNDVSPT